MKQADFLQSPLNYTGGKYKLLPQLLPHFPRNINTFVDLFCGGGNVGVNVRCNHAIFNDANPILCRLLETFRSVDKEWLFQKIFYFIEKYNLSDTSKYGYEHYGCSSQGGLGKYNALGFSNLKRGFNQQQLQDNDYYIMFYVMVVFSFNNQIRFNRKGEFNLPVGKRDFNGKMQKKLSRFTDRLKKLQLNFFSEDFRCLDNATWDNSTFVYCDPPYLITCATYNEQSGWSSELEKDLLSYLDGLHERNIRFALSNVLRSKGKENSLLISWVNENKHRYRLIPLSYSYANSSYQTKDRSNKSEEVLIINYEADGAII